MKVGDKVKVKAGKHAGKIGVIKSMHDAGHAYDCFDVEIPKMDRWCFFVSTELEVVPPTPRSPAEDVDRMVRLAAERVVQNWRRGVTFPILSLDIQTLEKALLN